MGLTIGPGRISFPELNPLQAPPRRVGGGAVKTRPALPFPLWNFNFYLGVRGKCVLAHSLPHIPPPPVSGGTQGAGHRQQSGHRPIFPLFSCSTKAAVAPRPWFSLGAPLARPLPPRPPMEQQQGHQAPERKGQKRKLEDAAASGGGEGAAGAGRDFGGDRAEAPSEYPQEVLEREVRTQVEVLNAAFSWKESDRSAAKRATHILAELAKNGALISWCHPRGLLSLWPEGCGLISCVDRVKSFLIICYKTFGGVCFL